MDINIEAVKKAINIPGFKHTELLEIALTHPSYIYEDRNLNSQQKDKQECDYRRQAILGDAILNAVVVDYLHENDSTLNQGKITDFEKNLVSRKKACEFAQKLNLRNICRHRCLVEEMNSNSNVNRTVREEIKNKLIRVNKPS